MASSSLPVETHPSRQWLPSREEVNDLRWRLCTGDKNLLNARHLKPSPDAYIGPLSFPDRLDTVLLEACLSYKTELYQSLLPLYLKHYSVDTLIRYISNEDVSTLLRGPQSIPTHHPHFQKSLSKRITLLHVAAESGNTGAVDDLLQRKASIDIRDCCMRTPLLVAILNGRYKTACYLIQRGANIELRDSNGMNPLMHLARTAHSKSAIGCLKQLLDTGTNHMASDAYGYTAFHHAAAEANSFVLSTLFLQPPFLQGDMRVNQGPRLYEVVNSKLILQNSKLLVSPLIPQENTHEKASALLLAASHFADAGNFQDCIDFMIEGVSLREKSRDCTVVSKPAEVFDYESIPATVAEMKGVIKRRSFRGRLKVLSLIIQDQLGCHCSLQHINSLYSVAEKYLQPHTLSSNYMRKAINLTSRAFELIAMKQGVCHIYDLPQLGGAIVTGLGVLRKVLSQMEQCLLDNIYEGELMEAMVVPFLGNNLSVSIQCLLYHSTVMSSKHVHFPKVFVVDEILDAILKFLERLLDFQRAWNKEFGVFQQAKAAIASLCCKLSDGSSFFSHFLHKIVGVSRSMSFENRRFVLTELLDHSDVAETQINCIDQCGQRLLHKASAEMKVILLSYGAHEDSASLALSSRDCYRLYMPKRLQDPLPLQCLCCQSIAEKRVPYKHHLPTRLIAFVELHDSKCVEEELMKL